MTLWEKGRGFKTANQSNPSPTLTPLILPNFPSRPRKHRPGSWRTHDFLPGNLRSTLIHTSRVIIRLGHTSQYLARPRFPSWKPRNRPGASWTYISILVTAYGSLGHTSHRVRTPAISSLETYTEVLPPWIHLLNP